MWQIKNPEIISSNLDFGLSGRNKFPVFQLFVEGIKLINALELVEWNEEHSQFLICEGCGYAGCKSGDWVSVRRSDSLVLFLPSSEHIWREEKDYMEYVPPAYLRQRGIPYLDSATYETLRSQHSSFPALDKLQPLNAKEAAVLFQSTAPDRIVGEPPEVSIQADLIVGSSEGDQSEPLKILKELLKKHYENESPAVLRSKSDNEQVISFYLDATAFTEWQAMVFDGSEYRLMVESKYVVDCTS